MNRSSIAVPVAISLISSIVYAFWNILSNIIVKDDPAQIYLSLTLIMVFGSLFTFAFTGLTSRGRESLLKFRLDPVSFAGGVFFALANIVFFSMIRVEALPVVAALAYSNIMVFSLLLAFNSKSRISSLYVLGTAIAAAGLAIMEISNSGISGKIDFYSIMESILLIVLYGVGSFFVFLSSQPPRNSENSIFMIFVSEVATIILASALTGQITNFGITSYTYLIEAVLIGFVLFVAVELEFKSFRLIGSFRTKYVNIVNIFSNFEIVWVLIYGILLLSLSSLPVIAGIMIVAIGIWAIASS